MKPSDLKLDGNAPERALITSRADCEDAVRIVLASATRLLRAMHTDLALFELSRGASVKQLERLLLGHRNARIRLLVDQSEWLESRAARLRLLQRHYSHALELRVASNDDPVGEDACLIADEHSVVNLQPGVGERGDLWLHHEPRVKAIASAFDRRWDAAAHNLAVVPLGLG